jgi:hypothetical protein
MACKLVVQNNGGTDVTKIKIKNPQCAPLVGDCIRVATDSGHAEYKILKRSFVYDDSGDVKITLRCEQVAAVGSREVDD